MYIDIDESHLWWVNHFKDQEDDYSLLKHKPQKSEMMTTWTKVKPTLKLCYYESTWAAERSKSLQHCKGNSGVNAEACHICKNKFSKLHDQYLKKENIMKQVATKFKRKQLLVMDIAVKDFICALRVEYCHPYTVRC